MAAFGLQGSPLALNPVAGAWSHRVYLLVTSRGRYAVKHLLDPWQDPNWRAWIHEASLFELAAFDAGVAMPRPILTAGGEVIAQVESGDGARRLPVRLHEWVEGRPCPPGPVDREVARRVGADLARMHVLNHRARRPAVFPQATADTFDRWPLLVERVRRQDPGLADRLVALEPSLDQMRGLFDAAKTNFHDDPMSHGDVDQKNILLVADGSVLCDWDVAAPWDRRAELARTAMSLAAWQRPDIARSTITAYASNGGDADLPLAPHDLAVDFVLGIDWLTLCIERATGLRAADDTSRRQNEQLVRDLLIATPRQVAIALDIERWLHQ